MPFLNLALFMICFFSLSTFRKIFLLVRQADLLLIFHRFFSRQSVNYTFFALVIAMLG